MERLVEIERRVASLGGLLNVVGVMRAIAATRAQQARLALPGIRAYASAVDAALAQAVPLLPPAPATSLARRPSAGPALLLFTSEHGFVGSFNDRLLRAAEEVLARGEVELLVVGSRGASFAVERGLKVAWSRPMASSVEGALALARSLAEEIYARLAGRSLNGLLLVYPHGTGGAAWETLVRPLLPFDTTPFRSRGNAHQPPLLNLPPQILVERLIDEFILAELARAATEALASENMARLLATDSARSNIEQRLGDLRSQAWHLRQEEITTELLDIVTGANAITAAAEGRASRRSSAVADARLASGEPTFPASLGRARPAESLDDGFTRDRL